MNVAIGSTFQCKNPDFTARSVPDGTTFRVKRTALERSEVFRDMFALCDAQGLADDEELDLHETAGELVALLQLLHDPPPPPTELPLEDRFKPVLYDPKTIIPLPLLLSVFFELTDKYALEDSVVKSLRVHLLANAPNHPLEVYGFAVLHNMEWEASAASQFVQPMASYTLEEVKVIPSVAAYHNVVQLQDFRVRGLRDVLLGEIIFPAGYGECSSHREKTRSTWDRQRKSLVGRIECVSDLAGEMDSLTDTFRECATCYKAWVAAVDMLRYKCYRVPRRLDQLPRVG